MNGRKYDIIEPRNFIERFKVLKFDLVKLDYAILFSNRRSISTYFFCQKVDICFTDKDNKIVYLYNGVKSERKIRKFKKYNIYIFPDEALKYYSVSDKLNVKYEKK